MRNLHLPSSLFTLCLSVFILLISTSFKNGDNELIYLEFDATEGIHSGMIILKWKSYGDNTTYYVNHSESRDGKFVQLGETTENCFKHTIKDRRTQYYIISKTPLDVNNLSKEARARIQEGFIEQKKPVPSPKVADCTNHNSIFKKINLCWEDILYATGYEVVVYTKRKEIDNFKIEVKEEIIETTTINKNLFELDTYAYLDTPVFFKVRALNKELGLTSNFSKEYIINSTFKNSNSGNNNRFDNSIESIYAFLNNNNDFEINYRLNTAPENRLYLYLSTDTKFSNDDILITTNSNTNQTNEKITFVLPDNALSKSSTKNLYLLTILKRTQENEEILLDVNKIIINKNNNEEDILEEKERRMIAGLRSRELELSEISMMKRKALATINELKYKEIIKKKEKEIEEMNLRIQYLESSMEQLQQSEDGKALAEEREKIIQEKEIIADRNSKIQNLEILTRRIEERKTEMKLDELKDRIEYLTFSIQTKKLFKPSKYKIRKKEVKLLQSEIKEFLALTKSTSKNIKIEIIGYTDGSKVDCKDLLLAYNRASSIKEYLIKLDYTTKDKFIISYNVGRSAQKEKNTPIEFRLAYQDRDMTKPNCN